MPVARLPGSKDAEGQSVYRLARPDTVGRGRRWLGNSRPARKRSRASPISTSMSCARSGAVSTKPMLSHDLSRELLIRALAYRIQGVALGGLRPELTAPTAPDRNGTEANWSGGENAFRPQLKPGTRLMREWQGRTYEVVVLDDGCSWQGARYRSLSAIARKDHRHGVVGAAVLRAEAKRIRQAVDHRKSARTMEGSHAAG